MNLNPQETAGKRVLSPVGRVDQTTAGDFQTALLAQITEADSGTVVLDMSGIEFMSSVGLRAVMMAFKQSKAAGGEFLIAALTPVVKEVFQISRFDTVLKCFDDVDSALNHS